MEIRQVLQIIAAIMITLTTILYSYHIFYLFLPLLLKKKTHSPLKRTRFAVLIAARNEEAVIPFLLDSISMQDYPAELIDTYVIADNCTDHTAKVSEEHGATVVTRFDGHLIGKGYALNYLIEHLRKEGKLEDYDAFMIFDADNLLEPDYFTQINQLPSDGYQAFCGYRNTKNYSTNWITYGYALWFLHESSHMNRSRYLIGSSACVNGTGFGFTRELLQRIGTWHFFTLTEDIEFSNWCASNGVRIGYCQDAVLYDEQPVTFRQSWKQRTRWAQGGVQVSLRYIRPLLKGIFKGHWITYACTELFSLSLWGFLLGGLTSILSCTCVFLSLPLGSALRILITLICSAYLTMVWVGLVTVLTEWKRIRANAFHKIVSVFSFPLFVITFVPITILSIFSKFQWEPISHTVAVSNSDLSQK